MWENARKVIGGMDLNEYHSHNANMQCPNLCATKPPPTNHAKLLGLGAKFCFQTRKLYEDKLNQTLKRFRYDVRVKSCVQTRIGWLDEEVPTLHIKNTDYNKMPSAPTVIEGAASQFE